MSKKKMTIGQLCKMMLPYQICRIRDTYFKASDAKSCREFCESAEVDHFYAKDGIIHIVF